MSKHARRKKHSSTNCVCELTYKIKPGENAQESQTIVLLYNLLYE